MSNLKSTSYKKPGGSLSMTIVTPVGKLLWTNLAIPKPNQSGKLKYNSGLAMSKPTFKVDGPGLKQAILTVAKDYFGEDKVAKLSDFAHFLKDGDESDYDYCNGCIFFNATSDTKPRIVGPDKVDLTEEEISRIKAGDLGRLVINIKGYSNSGNTGITAYLSMVQFKQPGTAIVGGSAANMALIDELEVELDDVNDTSEEVVAKPVAKKATKAPTPAPVAKKKKSTALDEEEVEAETEEEEEQEEVVAPVKAKKTVAAPAKKVVKKAPPVEEAPEEDDDILL